MAGVKTECHARQTAVINGAGPVGLIAAACLASRGFRVQVFEKGSLEKDLANTRSFSFSLDKRTFGTLQALGISSALLEQFEVKDLQIHPIKGRASITIPFVPSSSALAERHLMVSYLTSELNRLFKGRVSVHLKHKLIEVDLHKQRLFYECDGDTVSASYDLLVAADGVHSPVRAAMQQQVPGFKVHSDGSYESRCKTFLPSSFKQTPPDARASVHMHELCDPASKCCKNQHSGALWIPDIPGQATAEGHLHLHNNGLAQYTSKEDFQQLLGPCKLPKEVTDAMAEQAADSSRWHTTVNRLKCSQLHGPRVIILGEAAHTVTAHDGQGCNAGAEDVAVLGQVLDQESNLDKVPAAFNQARLKDVHALFDLNRTSIIKAGFCGPWHWEFLKHFNNVVIWHMLNTQLPFLVGPPVSTGASPVTGRPLSYSNIAAKCNERLFLTLLVSVLVAAGAAASIAGAMAALL